MTTWKMKLAGLCVAGGCVLGVGGCLEGEAKEVALVFGSLSKYHFDYLDYSHRLVGFVGARDFDLNFVDYDVELKDANLIDKGDAVRATGKLVILGTESTLIHAKRLKDRAELANGAGRRICSQVWPDFHEQITFGDCSLVLLPEGRVLTAAHCLKTPDDVKNARVIFEHTVERDWDLADNSVTVPEQDVHDIDCVFACSDTGKSDWIVLQLVQTPNRPVRKLDPKLNVEQGTKFTALFHPLGLPLKVTKDTVEVSECENDGFCFAPLDNGGAGSGGALLDADQNAIIGVLVGDGVKDVPLREDCLMPGRPERGQAFVPVQQIRAGLGGTPPQCPQLSSVQCSKPKQADRSAL